MSKRLGFEGIGYVAATFKVNADTISILESNFKNSQTGNVDINGKKLAVKLNTDGTVGFGASSPTTADALFGIIIAYESDGYASIQTEGFVEGVPTTSTINAGVKTLAVNNAGKLVSVDSTVARGEVIVPATGTGREVTILL